MTQNQESMKAIIETAVSIAKNPAEFYRNMPKTGGFMPPVLFVIVMSLLSGIIVFLYFLVGLGLMGEVTEQRIREVVEMGFGRVLFILPRRGREQDWATLDRYARLRQAFG